MSLPAGYEVMAEAFGDYVFLHADLYANCPVCSSPAMFTQLSQTYLVCAHCGFWEPCRVIESAQRWAVFPTKLFVEACGRRFYLPTAWNNSNPWISKEQLVAKYEEYEKEKASCLRRLQAA
jgi:hypothetical protein